MSTFGGLVFTNKGRNLQAKVQTGTPLRFSRMAIGDGNLGGSTIAGLNALKHEIKSMEISKLKSMPDGKAAIGGSFTNQDITTGFYWKELGIFAIDPDVGEILYCYGNAGVLAEYIPPGGGSDILEKNIDVIVLTANTASVEVTIDDSLIYATKKEVQDFLPISVSVSPPATPKTNWLWFKVL